MGQWASIGLPLTFVVTEPSSPPSSGRSGTSVCIECPRATEKARVLLAATVTELSSLQNDSLARKYTDQHSRLLEGLQKLSSWRLTASNQLGGEWSRSRIEEKYFSALSRIVPLILSHWHNNEI